MSSIAAQKKIASALNQAVEFSLDGLSPNEAIIKSAKLKDLTPEMTCRVVEAFNIAQTRAFLKTAEDKTASFPVADRNTILSEVFVNGELSTPKTASFQPREYPNFWEGNRTIAVVHGSSKTAAFADQETPEPLKRDLDDLMRQVKSQANERKIAMDCLRMENSLAQDKVMTSIEALKEFFEPVYSRDKFAEFEAEAYSEFGDGAKEVLSMVHKYAGLSGDLQDPALHSGRVFHQLDFVPQLGHLETALASREIWQDTGRKIAALEDLHSEQSAAIKTLVVGIALQGNSGFSSASDMLSRKEAGLNGAESQAKELFSKMPGRGPSMDMLSTGEASAVGKEYDAAAVSALRGERITHMGGGEMSEIDNLRRTVILQDLLLNDEILSKQDPRLVTNAYHSLLKTAPSATLIPEVTRSVLRNSVASQALDPHTATQLSDFEAAQAKNRPGAKPEKK